MTKHVQQFIEQNIESIEKKDWLNVFFSWYLHWGESAGFTTAQDNINIEELLSVLEVAFPHVREESHSARMEILKTKFCDYIHMLEHIPGLHNKKISWDEASDYLNSLLGLQEDSKSAFRSAAEECGYVIKGSSLIFEVD